MLCHPAGRHIWRWFLNLSRTRGKHTMILSSMAGSQVINEPAPISWTEIASWQAVTGNRLNSWEAHQISIVDAIYLNCCSKGEGKARSGQGLGEYCRGRDLEKCRTEFGGNEEMLKQVCSTCPN